jgi:hypothetical protein
MGLVHAMRSNGPLPQVVYRFSKTRQKMFKGKKKWLRLGTIKDSFEHESCSPFGLIFLLLSFIVPTQHIYIGLVTGLNSDATNQNSNLPAEIVTPIV